MGFNSAFKGLNILYRRKAWAGIPQSVQRLATGWTVEKSKPGGGEIFCKYLYVNWYPPGLLYSGYQVSFSEVKRPKRGVYDPFSSNPEIKGRVEPCFYSSSGSSWSVLGRNLPFLCLYVKGIGRETHENFLLICILIL